MAADDEESTDPPQRVVGTVASHLEDRIGRSERHLRDLINNMDRRVEQRFDDMEKAVAKAETAAEKRFDGVNEFREQLRDQAGTLLPRSEAEARLAALSEKVDRVIAWQERNEGQDSGSSALRSRQTILIGLMLTAVTAVIAVVVAVVNAISGG